MKFFSQQSTKFSICFKMNGWKLFETMFHFNNSKQSMFLKNKIIFRKSIDSINLKMTTVLSNLKKTQIVDPISTKC